jgi:hypothetical protein
MVLFGPKCWGVLAAAAMSSVLFAEPVAAVSCNEARALTTAQLNYWGMRLEVTPEKLSALLEFSFCLLPRVEGAALVHRGAASKKIAAFRRESGR